MEFTDTERAVLRIVQHTLPDSAAPYADIAAAAGTDEGTVLELLSRLRESGAIRRFGATLRHQKAGWACNAMVAWKVAPADADAAGTRAAEHPRVSHCYLRPAAPDWPYTLYTMVHGRTREECLETVEELRRNTALDEYRVLETLKELKKTSMTYF